MPTQMGVLQKVVVIGGNGFVGAFSSFPRWRPLTKIPLGSAVCKAVLAKGIKVTSVRQAFSNLNARDPSLLTAF